MNGSSTGQETGRRTLATEIVWFRRDARLLDNPAWSAAAEAGEVLAVFVIDPPLYQTASRRRKAFLVGGLRALDERLSRLGGRLRVEHGDPRLILPRLVSEIGASKVHINREVSPYGVARDKAVALVVDLITHDGTYVHPPRSILNGSGDPYKVFTPYYRQWATRPFPAPNFASETRVLDDPGQGLPDSGQTGVGEEAARASVDSFLERIGTYETERDRLDLDGTSRLSIPIKYGWLSPGEVARRVDGLPGSDAFLRQLAWRDFFAQALAVNPGSVDQSLRPEYRSIRWSNEAGHLEAWQQGRTGYPLVDAGMRQLLAEGWMSNRVRMITASFLVKHLLIDWREGERWFRHQLLDADVAQNVGNWQWVAGTGHDAAPYFRVLNPVAQSRRHDPRGRYIRRWVPELASLSDAAVHAPWEADPSTLAVSGFELGFNYPYPLVDHPEARRRAIEEFEAARRREPLAQPPV